MTEQRGLLVGLSVVHVSPAKTAQPIEMPFGLRTRVGSVVMTIELSPPPGWLATIEPPPPPRCRTVFSAVFLALFP